MTHPEWKINEMIDAFERAAERRVGRNSLAGIFAVLAIVERDYEVKPRIKCTRCAAPWPAQDGVTCDVERGHVGNHRTRSGLVWS